MGHNELLIDVGVAYHEAGHAIAASMCGIAWHASAIEDEDDGTDGRTLLWEPAGLTHNLAFIYWAGSYAEGREVYTDDGAFADVTFVDLDDPGLWDAVGEVQARNQGGTDAEMMWAYWCDESLAPHATELEWARTLEPAWFLIRDLADRLCSEGEVNGGYPGDPGAYMTADERGWARFRRRYLEAVLQVESDEQLGVLR